MQVKVTRVVDENLSVVLPSLLELELHTANVVLLLDNQTVLKARKCFLSASPVLKEVLMSLEARLDKLPHISMPGYSKECVVSFLHFLYKGFVVLENTSNQQEFLRLCRTLKVNPPVCSQRCCCLSDDEMVVEEPVSAEVQDSEAEPEFHVTKKRSSSVTKSSEMEVVDEEVIKRAKRSRMSSSPSPSRGNSNNAEILKTPIIRTNVKISVSSPSTAKSNIVDKIVTRRKEKSSLDKHKMSFEAGWVREVVTGDRKCSDPNRMRVAYLPPRSIRHIKKRLHNKTDLQAFLTTHCADTNLTLDNFSFSNHVLGLDIPWEVVREVHISLEQVTAGHSKPIIKRKRSKSAPPRPPPPSFESCALHLSQSGLAAVQHVNHWEEEDLSPVPPVKYQPMPRSQLSLSTLPASISVTRFSM